MGLHVRGDSHHLKFVEMPLRGGDALDGDIPSVFACYCFASKLRDYADLLDGCMASVLRALKGRNPALGKDVAGLRGRQRAGALGARSRDASHEPSAIGPPRLTNGGLRGHRKSR